MIIHPLIYTRSHNLRKALFTVLMMIDIEPHEDRQRNVLYASPGEKMKQHLVFIDSLTLAACIPFIYQKIKQRYPSAYFIFICETIEQVKYALSNGADGVLAGDFSIGNLIDMLEILIPVQFPKEKAD
jgi:hypothetical protein